MFKAIKNQLEKLLHSAGVAGEIEFAVPPKPEMGDLAFACFDLAKEWKVPPMEAARMIAGKTADKKMDIIEKIDAIGPYVNFYFNTGRVAAFVLTAVRKQGRKYGQNKEGRGRSVLLEYPSNNTHKELHVGHLRNICIGSALAALFSASGYKVILLNYVNDFGSHVAKCLWGLRKFHCEEKPPADKQKWLGQIYAEAGQYLKDHPESKDEVDGLQIKLEAKDKSIWPLFVKTRRWSLDGFFRIFKELGVRHDFVFYEKDVRANGQRMVDNLFKKGIAAAGEGGAIIVDLGKFALDTALLRKSNGGGVYLTSDLGLAAAKGKKFKADESLHVTGLEQDFYFKQLFKILELAGYHYKMTHIGYGLVNSPGGKMSSRAGNVVLYEDARDMVYKKVFEETKSRHGDWSRKKIGETSRKISFAALKFDFLKHEASKNIIFDASSAASFDGFTGPYIQYAAARINSILKKSPFKNFKKINFDLLKQPEEKSLVLSLARYDEIVVNALRGYNPSIVAKYAFDLAKQFNDFYNKHNVLNAEDKELMKARLCLCRAVRQILSNTLNLLSIETVKEM